MLKLISGHICFDSVLVEELFGKEEQVNTVYYPERGVLLVAARSKTFFEKLHKTSWTVLKLKNAKGDKIMMVRDLLIDYELDDTERILHYEIKNTGIIEIRL